MSTCSSIVSAGFSESSLSNADMVDSPFRAFSSLEHRLYVELTNDVLCNNSTCALENRSSLVAMLFFVGQRLTTEQRSVNSLNK
jgi:hypothetical protein